MSIYEKIAAATQNTLRGVEQDPLYECPPRIEKVEWDALGDMIAARERAFQQPRSDQCYTLRLDITGMSTLKKQLVSEGTFSERWCSDFSEIMIAVARDLTARYGARWCYTQSDEITLVIVAPSKETHPRFQHHRGGKLMKLVSLAAARASAVATALLTRLRDRRARERVAPAEWWPQRLYRHLMGTPAEVPMVPLTPVTLEFDCRMAVWDTALDAFQLVLWRAYDCGVNGVSDAIYNQRGTALMTMDGTSYKVLMGAKTWVKLKWLERAGLLPMPQHQAYGTLLQYVDRERAGYNPVTQQTVTVMRKEVTRVEVNNIITAVQQGSLIF